MHSLYNSSIIVSYSPVFYKYFRLGRIFPCATVASYVLQAFLTPSGSDAEFLPTALARVRARRLGHKVLLIGHVAVHKKLISNRYIARAGEESG